MKDLDKRFWEVDFARGLAILGAVLYNYIFALKYFKIYTLKGGHLFWWLFPRIIAGTFLLLVGLSLTLSYSRAVKKRKRKSLFLKYFKRGVKIFLLGLGITLVTFIFLPEGFIAFGILHLIGVSIIFAYPFLRYDFSNFVNLILGVIFLVTGIYLTNLTFDFNWLLWLGFIPSKFYTVDYFPIFPWLGFVLIGIFLGNFLYPDYERNFNLLEVSKNSFVKFMNFIGKYTLWIYLAHQPILFGILYWLGMIRIF